MKIDKALLARCGNKCELCSAEETELSAFEVPPSSDGSINRYIAICANCKGQVEDPETIQVNHWHCLNESMWSQVPAVQVSAWRMLKKLSGEPWAQDLLDMLYLEEDVQAWAEEGFSEDEGEPTRDCNGAILKAGDTVTVIKDLDVKGAGFTAKRGTAVRNISLTDNPEHIEGRVNGTRLVLLSCYMKKST
jgi:protein PhnA